MHHPRVTQCFGSIGGHVWYLGVAKPSLLDPDQVEGDRGSNVVQSHDGHFYMPPAIEDVRVFRFSGRKFVKLNMGTWHAGPLFDPQMKMDFYNLELSNTHVSFSIPIFSLPLYLNAVCSVKLFIHQNMTSFFRIYVIIKCQ